MKEINKLFLYLFYFSRFPAKRYEQHYSGRNEAIIIFDIIYLLLLESSTFSSYSLLHSKTSICIRMDVNTGNISHSCMNKQNCTFAKQIQIQSRNVGLSVGEKNCESPKKKYVVCITKIVNNKMSSVRARVRIKLEKKYMKRQIMYEYKVIEKEIKVFLFVEELFLYIQNKPLERRNTFVRLIPRTMRAAHTHPSATSIFTVHISIAKSGSVSIVIVMPWRCEWLRGKKKKMGFLPFCFFGNTRFSIFE